MNTNNINQFWNQFNEFCTITRNLIHQISKSLDYNEILPLKAKLSEMQELITATASILPLYDIKRSLNEYDGLNKQMKEIESLIQPRQTFQFSEYTMNNFILPTLDINSKTLEINESQTHENKIEKELAEIIKQKESSDAMNLLYMQLGSYAIKNESKKVLFLTQADLLHGNISHKDSDMKIQLLISDCDSIMVSVKTVLGSIRLENIKNSIILLGPCSTSCYLENCHNNIICIASHQLRIHNTINTHLYVKCNSHPIIEDCNGLGFADYSMLNYHDIETHIKDAGLEGASCWNNVVDFKWHKDIQSPNFYILPSPEYMLNNIETTSSNSNNGDNGCVDMDDGLGLGGRFLFDQWNIFNTNTTNATTTTNNNNCDISKTSNPIKIQQMQYRMDEIAIDTTSTPEEEDEDEM